MSASLSGQFGQYFDLFTGALLPDDQAPSIPAMASDVTLADCLGLLLSQYKRDKFIYLEPIIDFFAEWFRAKQESAR